MSFETDAPIRTLCPVCEKYCESEGYGESPTVLDADGTVYHTKCRPELCQHERHYVCDWKSIEGNDSVVYVFACRDCPARWEDELVGAQLRAEGKQDEEDDGE